MAHGGSCAVMPSDDALVGETLRSDVPKVRSLMNR